MENYHYKCEYMIKRLQEKVFGYLAIDLDEIALNFEDFRLWIKCLVDTVYFKIKGDTDYLISPKFMIFERNYLTIIKDIIGYVFNNND